MNTVTASPWTFLEPRPKSGYRQLFVKGTRIRADVIYGLHASEQEPMTVQEIAEDYGLALEAIQEAIAYCESNPPEIEEDFRREEALMKATGMNHPAYKFHPSPRVISPAERARILDS